MKTHQKKSKKLTKLKNNGKPVWFAFLMGIFFAKASFCEKIKKR